MRLAVYGCVSSILAIGVVLSAMHQRSNFYAACIYLSKSSACMMVRLIDDPHLTTCSNSRLIDSIEYGPYYISAIRQSITGRLLWTIKSNWSRGLLALKTMLFSQPYILFLAFIREILVRSDRNMSSNDHLPGRVWPAVHCRLYHLAVLEDIPLVMSRSCWVRKSAAGDQCNPVAYHCTLDGAIPSKPRYIPRSNDKPLGTLTPDRFTAG